MNKNQQILHDNHLVDSTEKIPSEIIIGDLVEINKLGEPVINYDGNSLNKSLVAISTVALNKKHIGRKVAILFANGNVENPVIMGLIHSPLNEMLDSYESEKIEKDDDMQQLEIVSKEEQDLKIDGKRIVLEGKEEVVLKCGDASITLTKAGKILIRGKYLLNRSDGVNRIMGGSVQIN